MITAQSGELAYVGFEPSATVAAVARNRGVDMRAELFESNSLAEPVGAVVLDNVIEHLVDPMGLLESCVHALRPEGILVVIVPNRHDIRQLIPRWRESNHWIPPEHINYFTPASLRRTLGQLNLEVHPFGFGALEFADWKYWPRALGEKVGLFPFGLNFYGRLRPAAT